MNTWQIKAAKDGIKAALPFQGYLRSIKRAVAPHFTNPQNDVHLLGDSLRQVAACQRLGIPITGKTIVEIGSGWSPILPIIYRRAGAGRVVTVDQERLIDRMQIQHAIKFLYEKTEAISDKTSSPLSFPPGSLPSPDLSADEFFLHAGIEYKAPFNFLELPLQSADMVVSRDVLEHIPEDVLTRIVDHAYAILRPGGFVCHTIDMSDHWEHADKTISKVNFLQYDGIWWKLAGTNPQNYQNRLRRYEYLDMFRRAGFQILDVNGEPDRASLASLGQMKLCARYGKAPLDELAVLSTTIIAQRP